jgi:hypothetical protein
VRIVVAGGDFDGTAARPWWIDAIDPVENLRTLARVQDFGRQAAEEVADRLLASGDGRREATLSDADRDRLARRFQAEAVRASEVVVNFLDLFATLVGDLGPRMASGSQPAPGAGPVVLEAVKPAAEASAVFWIHNSAAAAIPEVRPHCGPLRSHLGQELAAGAVHFDPDVLDPLPARSSCGIEVRCRIPPDAVPGSYASLILVSNLPELSLPLWVTVRDEVPGA